GPGLDRLAGRGDSELLLLHQDANPLQRAECGVPFVEVADGRLLAEGPQGADAADPEHDLLLDPVLFVAAVKLGGDIAVVRLILRDVAIEQVERHPADLDAPDLGLYRAPGQRDRHEDRLAGRVGLLDQRQCEEVVFRVALLLPAIGIQILPEVALPVHQADADERYAEVTGTFQMVPGQDAEAAGIDGDALVDAEFGGEVGNRDALGFAAVRIAEPRAAAEVAIQTLDDAVEVGEEAVVRLQLLQSLLGDRAEQP